MIKKVIAALWNSVAAARFAFKAMLVRWRYPAGSFSIGRGSKLFPSADIVINNAGKDGKITIGDNTLVRGELLNFGHGGNIQVGDFCYIGRETHIWSASNISIGDRVLISHNVNIFDNLTHPLSAMERHTQFKLIISSGHPTAISLDEKPITIRSDALIGCGAIILRGVTIGEGAVVGAGAVVTRNVPPWTIVAGNPAKVIREIPEHER